MNEASLKRSASLAFVKLAPLREEIVTHSKRTGECPDLDQLERSDLLTVRVGASPIFYQTPDSLAYPAYVTGPACAIGFDIGAMLDSVCVFWWPGEDYPNRLDRWEVGRYGPWAMVACD